MSRHRRALPSLAMIGASVRAVAHSAIRGGSQVQAFDLFADADLIAACATTLIEHFDASLVEHLKNSRADAWMYTGPLENQPLLVHALSQVVPLAGCDATVLAHVRDPQWLAETLHRAGFVCPEIRWQHPGNGRQRWLRKRVASGGGIGIERLTAEFPEAENLAAGHYYQRLVPGRPVSGMFLADGQQCQLLAMFEQWIGQQWTAAPGEFTYCGAIGPLSMPAEVAEQMAAIGRVLTERASLRGLFGIDAILSGEQITVLEVNPRYTASMELWERATGQSAVALHCEAARGCVPPGMQPYQGPGTFGKAIVYAERESHIGRPFHEMADTCNDSIWPTLADIPRLGQRIAAGEPICTLIAGGDTATDVQCQLQRLAIKLQAALG